MEGMKGVTSLLLVISATFAVTQQCLKADDIHVCGGRLSYRDYNACVPDCQNGVYITCAPGGAKNRKCPKGYYYKDGQQFTADLVFDPVSNRCEYTSSSCPRPDIDPYKP